MLHAIAETARWTTGKITAIRDLLRTTGDFVRDKEPRAYSRELIDVIFEQPYCRIANVVNAGIAKRQTASEYLTRLAEIRVLEPVQSGRDKLFINRALLGLLASETHEVAPVYNPRR
jgi:Fic family protein